MSGHAFVLRQTKPLRRPPDGDLDVVRVGRAIGDRIDQVTGIHVRFGGTYFDKTKNSEENALKSAAEGVNINGENLNLRTLGLRKTDVSVFVTVEIPDEALKEVLQRFGEFQPAIRRLRLKEKGLNHIENWVRVVSFKNFTQRTPNTVVCQGIPIGFQYTGQVKLSFNAVQRTTKSAIAPKETRLPRSQPTSKTTNRTAKMAVTPRKNKKTCAQTHEYKRRELGLSLDSDERPNEQAVTDNRDLTFDP